MLGVAIHFSCGVWLFVAFRSCLVGVLSLKDVPRISRTERHCVRGT